MKLSVILVSLIVVFFAFFSITKLAAVETPTATPALTPTEASGGIIGTGVDELRCPKNLSGIGPTWNGITIGVSSIEDLSAYFGQEKTYVTPYPPYAGEFAPNYEFLNSNIGLAYSCVVNGKVAALLLDRHAVSKSYLPQGLVHWVSFLGIPALISWHQSFDKRLLHWPQYGTSVTVNVYDELPANYADTEWVYFYPFRDENYENLWPVNYTFAAPAFIEEMPELQLNDFDFDAIQVTLTLAPTSFLWPTVTPRPEATQIDN